MAKSRPRRYRRLDKAERAAIERGLDKNRSAREMARDLGRSPSSVVDEIRRNRTVARGPGKGERVAEAPATACRRLLSWPWVCNGCKRRRYHCSMPWRCEHSATRAQRLADELLADARRGVNRSEEEFELIMSCVRADLGRGLSPAQICLGRCDAFKVSAPTLYRWIARGYAGLSNMDLRRQVGYKERKAPPGGRATPHGPERGYGAFLDLGEECSAACEMDTVAGRARDSQCILTLYLRPCRFQALLLLPEKTSGAVAAALDSLERALGKKAFPRLFGLVLTDNGAEFSDCEAIERSALPGRKGRCKVYYCDVRQSQQKAGCERNHVELRKLLPKHRGVPFDGLEPADLAVLMSHLNSEPRPSLAGMSPAQMLLAAYGPDGQALMDALGCGLLAYEELDLSADALNRARAERGLGPLI